MQLEIVTPEKVILNQQVTSVIAPGIRGEFQILDHHAPVISVLTKGALKLSDDVKLDDKIADLFHKKGNKFHFNISGGVLEMNNNKVIILTD